MKSIHPDYPKARRLLSRRDPVMKQLIKDYGPCTLQPSDDFFAVLVRSIVAQQISSKAAKSISAKLQASLKPKALRPKTIMNASEDTLREAGLSAAKRGFLRDLAEKVLSRQVRLSATKKMTDEDVISHLLPVRGIGRWTAEMFLIFCLGRLDVLPVADLGLRAGVQRLYELDELPKTDKLHELAEPWQPYRTVATWYFWRSFGNVPQS